MKSIFLSLLLLAGLYGQRLRGQCLTNGTFVNMASCVNPGTCNTWPGTDCNGWIRSHGTPEIKPYTYVTDPKGGTTVSSYLMYMWTDADVGEGAFTAYTFQAGQSYDVRLQFSTQSGGSGQGTVNVYAANGLVQHAMVACGDAPPAISSLQLVGQYFAGTSSNVDHTFNFTANASYSQLWIYPTCGVFAEPYELFLFNVYACPGCPTNVLTYNTGNLPSGGTSAATINAGSSAGTGGSGIVGVVSNQSTTLTATNEIGLFPSFQASLTTGGNFVAQILPCNTTNSVAAQANPYASAIVTLPVVPMESGAANHPAPVQPATPPPVTASGLQVYPTVSNGLVTITGSSADLAGADILVTDESGRTVFRSHNTANTTIPLDLGNLRNGMYFLQIRNNVKILTQKIIINK